MPEGEKELELYPSNWLYNAGVIGFLRVLEELGKIENAKFEKGKITIGIENFKRKKGEIFPNVVNYLMDYYFTQEELNKWKGKKDGKGNVYEKKYKEETKTIIGKSEKDLNKGYQYLALRGKLFGSNTPFQNLIQKDVRQLFRLDGPYSAP